MRSRALRRWVRGAGVPGMVGLAIMVLVILCAVLAPVLTAQSPTEVNLVDKLQLPFSPGHLLGTDNMGRDLLSRVLWGSRISLLVGLLGSALAGVVGTLAGLCAGYYRSWVDVILMRIADVQLAFPFILLAIAVMGVLKPGTGNILIIAMLSGWVKYARVVRSNVLAIREAEYIQAGKALGMSELRLLLRHLLPNVVAPAIVVLTLETGRIILMEASLTFLGLGVPSSVPTWGTMLSDGRVYLVSAPWLAILPGVAITITVLGVNLLGDWLRDRLDPRMRT